MADGLILPGHLALSADEGMLDHFRELAHGGRVGGYLNAMPPTEKVDMEQAWPTAGSRLDDVYLYHGGLLSQGRLDVLTRSITSTLRQATPRAV